jgi:hypothetical protein
MTTRIILTCDEDARAGEGSLRLAFGAETRLGMGLNRGLLQDPGVAENGVRLTCDWEARLGLDGVQRSFLAKNIECHPLGASKIVNTQSYHHLTSLYMMTSKFSYRTVLKITMSNSSLTLISPRG